MHYLNSCSHYNPWPLTLVVIGVAFVIIGIIVRVSYKANKELKLIEKDMNNMRAERIEINAQRFLMGNP